MSNQPVAEAATYTTHNRRTSMPSAGFEPAISVTERHYIHTLYHAATAIRQFVTHIFVYWLRLRFGRIEANETCNRCASHFDAWTKVCLVWNLNWLCGRRNGWMEVYQLMMAYDAISRPERNVILNSCATLHLYSLVCSCCAHRWSSHQLRMKSLDKLHDNNRFN